ncbi:hypothetical protein AMATHDRAFT_1757 [Amanita thiersii Skay4041]|uniref:alkaline phosphatase n=1 Tax=Amanita thiersii Skay4041 TaxID=703135 RepID=A0A2A9NYV4_9AGAR|nr:hypothetical protein AMATHDRAFT_1757 [Amanita thiersii Skay4041]
MWRTAILLTSAIAYTRVSGQTFKRLGGCPSLGCILPPDQTDFLPGQLFDIRLEVHAPVNGSEAFNNGVPDEEFTFCIQRDGADTCEDIVKYFNVQEPELEKWSFSYFEDLFARDEGKPVVVNVASKAYRALSLSKAGRYTAKLQYNGSSQTTARWVVREAAQETKAKNVLFFIGDGMTQPMITAARLITHKSINGIYQSLMQMDQMDDLGHQMTHSMDSFITDSANSATALYTGKKSSVNTLNVWADSSETPFDDPKVETIAELFRRRRGGPVGMVSTALIADATPAALCSHSRHRDQYPSIVHEYLYGAEALTPWLPWPTSCEGPDVVFGGGAEQFLPGSESLNGTDYYKAFQEEGYNVVHTKEQLFATDIGKKTLGIFTSKLLFRVSVLFLPQCDRIAYTEMWVTGVTLHAVRSNEYLQVYPQNLRNQHNSPTGDGSDAIDQPGLKEMTLKAIDILQKRAEEKQTGWFLMSEAASIDKMMHALDYDRALGELLELDDTLRASIQHLKDMGEYENTLIVVTADHGHGFDVYGGVDTKYLAAQTDDRKKRDAVGIYDRSGLSGYTVAEGSLPNNDTVVVGPQGPNFPVQWNPRYTFSAGFAANPDHREGFVVNTTGPRNATTSSADGYVVNPKDQPQGFFVSGTIPVESPSGVHSLQDVSVFANGPGSEAFRGVYNNIEIFFKMASALGLGKDVDRD